MKSWLLVLLLVAATATKAREAPWAPLPAHFTNEASHGENEDYRPVPDQRGLYAHGVAGPIWSSEFDGAPCVGTAAEQNQVIESLPGGMSEFWFYGTGTQGILLTRMASFDPAKPCATALSFQYDIERAYVSDGFIHSFNVDQSNDMRPLGSWPFTHSAGEYSSSFERIHSLMARPGENRRERKHGTDTIAGVKAVCRGTSGLVWSSVCTAMSGPARGMILSAQSGDDERVMFFTAIKELRPDVMIPGILFEVDREWIGKD